MTELGRDEALPPRRPRGRFVSLGCGPHGSSIRRAMVEVLVPKAVIRMREHVVRPVPASPGEGEAASVWRLIARPSRPPDIAAAILDYWHGVGIMDIDGEVDVGILRVRDREPTFVEMERHHRTPELLVALDGDLLVPLTVGDSAPDLERLEVVAIERGTGILLNTAVWHAIPFSPTAPATCLVVFRRGTSVDDLEVVPLSTTVRVEADGLSEEHPTG